MTSPQRPEQPIGNVLILDHLNINHQQGRHDWLKAFYFDFLGCAVDPRKAENLEKGSKTLWANIGATQFHLPEGKPDAQVLQGIITLSYDDLRPMVERIDAATSALEGSMFGVTIMNEGFDDDSANGQNVDALEVTDPWGSVFRIVKGTPEERDGRGQQPGAVSEGMAIRDILLYTPSGSNIAGIGRFYEQVIGAPLLEDSPNKCVVSVGPMQTLTFVPKPKETSDQDSTEGAAVIQHEDMRDDGVEPPEGMPSFLSNYGPHISMYVADLSGSYKRADDLGLAYVNPRFSRRAYTLDQAIDDCMFRCLDIVDPADPAAGTIIRLEHEVRSVVKRDGSMYKSCPFNEIPDSCLSSGVKTGANDSEL